ncbi:LamG domain-containing protein [Paenibacillus puerhi]|uniref:LamG domain-containing protein n=1 Tax=Paenibacillus puerhi TaxID=2692622 RepID=UPI0013579CC1|nr:LamG domain-containing protein [Paenibacillus puerhi]
MRSQKLIHKRVRYLLLLAIIITLQAFFTKTSFSSSSNYYYDSNNRLLYSGPGESYKYDRNGNLLFKFLSKEFNHDNYVTLDMLFINTEEGAKNTVEFWMYWDGTNSVMPMSWENYYTLWFANGYFGFNTGESNILGISSDNLANRWLHVAAVFYNGVPNAGQNELYIDGEKQLLEPKMGTTTRAVAATKKAYISGTGGTELYRMGGRIGEVRIWNYALTETEVKSNMYRVLQGNETGLASYWRLSDAPAPSKSVSFNGSEQITVNNLTVNTEEGAKNTVEFWMYWDGTNSVMPVSWENYYTLWFANGYFGFNTGESNILGISSTNLANRWVHVVTVFYNGVPNAVQNELYIDGEKQNLEPKMGITTRSVTATEKAYISGTGGTELYRMGGKIGEVRVWNYALSEKEVKSNMYKVLRGNESGLVGYWVP